MNNENKENSKKIYDNLKEIKSEDCTEILDAKKELALYLHIPFCEKKCNYCSFVSFCGKAEKFDEYISCVIYELQIRKENNAVLRTIYIGGGTPSLLSDKQMEKLLTAIYQNYEVLKDAEITIEVNPNSITKEKLIAYKMLGINRISVGVQSLNNKRLQQLGRLHTSSQVIEKLELIKSCGFTNISVDLIIGLPNQTIFEIKRAIKKLSKYATHFSIYSLSIEENTPFYDMFNKGELKLPNEKKSAKFYLMAVTALKKLGFERYEVSNFALDGYKSKHNKTYWEMQDYLGIGLASHSFIGNERIANTEDLDVYLNNLKHFKPAFVKEKLSKKELMEETIMLNLRESEGLNLEKFKNDFQIDLIKQKKNEIALLKQLELIEINDNHLKVTDKGILVLNQIIIRLI
ncbi:MAG: radical SAM family heme chaperone HemW [Clostridia bacterium]|nr:radical SAM family heme chaperone HemW [Clostridia bacterium]